MLRCPCGFSMYEGCDKHFPEDGDAPSSAAVPEPPLTLGVLEAAVEKAWEDWSNYRADGKDDVRAIHVAQKVGELLSARRAAREAGYVSVLVSREAIEALREAGEPYDIQNPDTLDHARAKACVLLAFDLAAVRKP